jgi:uncharacterized protein
LIAVDTNILVPAHRRDASLHAAARRRITELAEGRQPWALPWPCVHEFLAIVTHPRIFQPPSSLDAALRQVEAWAESPSLRLIGEAQGHLAQLRSVLTPGDVVGPRVHDGRVAAICRSHGVTELWTVDRDFSRFPGVVTRNPLL